VVGSKHVPARNKFLTEIKVIVDFAIEIDKNALIFIGHRLIPADKIDNRQPSVPKKDVRRAIFVKSLTIRTPMLENPDHCAQVGTITRTHKTGDTAHFSYFCSGKLISSRT
jgi:hypothetical protein